jgi:hypothetical protein
MITTKNSFVFLFLLLFRIPGILAQQDYGDFTIADKSPLFTESFDNNSNSWIIDNSWIQGRVDNGQYEISCKNYQGSTGLSYKPIAIDQNRDFEIEASIKILKGSGSLIFGVTDKFDHYRLEISDKKQFYLVKNTPSKQKIEKLLSKSDYAAIRIQNFNKLTLRKIQNTYYVFVNEALAGQFNNIILEGNQLGFNVGLNSDIIIEDIHVSYLNGQAPQIAWQTPSEGNVTSSTSQYNLKACLRSTGSIRSARLEVNGLEIPVDQSLKKIQSGDCMLVFEYMLTLKQGENVISLTASNFSGSTSSEKRLITYNDNITAQNRGEIPLTGKDKNIQLAAAPIIVWENPSTIVSNVSSGAIRVRAAIKSGERLQALLLYINGASAGDPGFIPLPNENGDVILERNINLQQGENTIYIVATNSAGSSKSDMRYLTNVPASPPVINWSNPVTGNSTVSTESFNIEACINSGTNLQSAQVFVNGVQQASEMVFQPSGRMDCNYVLQRPVILREGDNAIFIIATNTAGSSTSEKRTIRLEVALTEKRLALVIGNSNYGERSLKNPVNDANLIESTLKGLGFEVIKRINATRMDMENAIKEFSKKLNECNVALFYYAGHGLQVDGMNYLIPVDAVMKEKEDCKWEAVAVNYVVEEFEKYPENTNIVILDACRDNPFRNWVRGGEAGFKAIMPTSGTIISFATSEGAVAADGTGANGLFTEELVKQMVVPQPIESVFKKTRVQVETRSRGAQSPQEWSKLKGDFYFRK